MGRIDGLQVPWSTVYLPDGTAVISERDSAQLRTIKAGQLGTLGKVPGVVPGGEGGLLGLALSPGLRLGPVPLRLFHRGGRTTGSPVCG